VLRPPPLVLRSLPVRKTGYARTPRGAALLLLSRALPRFYAAFPFGGRPKILEIGPGDGAFGAALKSLCPSALITGVEAEPLWLPVLRRQGTYHKVIAGRHEDIAGRFDLVIGNPPWHQPIEAAHSVIRLAGRGALLLPTQAFQTPRGVEVLAGSAVHLIRMLSRVHYPARAGDEQHGSGPQQETSLWVFDGPSDGTDHTFQQLGYRWKPGIDKPLSWHLPTSVLINAVGHWTWHRSGLCQRLIQMGLALSLGGVKRSARRVWRDEALTICRWVKTRPRELQFERKR